MTIGRVINQFLDEWEAAKDLEYIKKPFSYALYKTWKWCDIYEAEELKHPKRKHPPVGKKCRECRFLSEKNKKTIGRECTCPHKKFRRDLAKWKQPSGRACGFFEEKE